MAKTESQIKRRVQVANSGNDIFDEIEAELPEDMSGLSFDGRNIEPHGRKWLDDDGR